MAMNEPVSPLAGLFTAPKPMKGKRPDRTGGKGYVKSADNNRMERALAAIERTLSTAMTRMDAFADANAGVDSVPLDDKERIGRWVSWSSKGQSYLDQLAGVFGVEAMNKEQDYVVQAMLKERAGGL